MASLDAFLADLDDLNEEEDEGEEEEIIEEEDDDDGDIDMLAETGGGGGAAGTSGLLASSRMASLMEKIEAYMVADAGDGVVAPPAAPQDDAGAVYALIVQCNEIAVDIDNEVEALAKHIRDDYAKRFPELESLIPNPLDFARVVLKIGNEADLTQVDLTGILPSATIMVVTVTSSTTIGTELPPQALAAVSERCEQVLALSDNKQRILAFVESKMAIVAPNVVAIVGAATAAKLVGAAGGMSKLAELPSTVVQILGSKKRALAGMPHVDAEVSRAHVGGVSSQRPAVSRHVHLDASHALWLHLAVRHHPQHAARTEAKGGPHGRRQGASTLLGIIHSLCLGSGSTPITQHTLSPACPPAR
uniref:Nop domain-containing protein n=1 Tax=Emiliania huxleyi TaxID=2903 RepID=A0A7S3W6R7_EMIHU